MTDARTALGTAAEVGEFFALTTPDGAGWHPVRILLDDPVASGRRVERVRSRLAASARVPVADVPLRTAASVDLQGLAARIVSPALAATALARVTPRLSPGTLWLCADTQRIAVTEPRGAEVATDRQAADALLSHVVEPVLAPLVAAYAAHHRVSTRVLWGNVASALHGALLVLDASRLPQRIAAGDVVADVLAALPPAAAVRVTAAGFFRNSCCLWYRIPGTAICGDCVLAFSRRVARPAAAE